jgi:hypothetical protein
MDQSITTGTEWQVVNGKTVFIGSRHKKPVSLVASAIPGTRQFKERRQLETELLVQERLKMFHSMPTLDDKDKEALRSRITPHLSAYASVDVKSTALMISLLSLLAIIDVALTTTVISRIIKTFTIFELASIYAQISAPLVAVIWTLITFFGSILLAEQYAKFVNRFNVPLLETLLCNVFVNGILCFIAVMHKSGYISHVTALSAIGLTVFYVILMACIGFKVAIMNSACHHHPEHSIVDGLLIAAYHAGKFDTAMNVETISLIIDSNLAEVAQAIPKLISNKPMAIDLDSDDWNQTTVKKMTNGIARMRQLARFPSKNGVKELPHKITRHLVAAIDGRWGDFDRIDRQSEIMRISVIRRVGSVIRAIFVAGLPSFALWGWQYNTALLRPPYLQYAYGTTLVWAVITILSSTDPAFPARVAAFRDAASSLLRYEKP